MEQSKATIIGGKGFIGGHLFSRLQNNGWDCIIPDKQTLNHNTGNLGHIFYCAGLTSDFLDRPFDTVEAHVLLLSRILQEKEFESLTYLSSTRLYDSQQSGNCSEDDSLILNPTIPRHLYDLSKSLGESLCLLTGNNKARIARLSCVYNDHTDSDGFLPGLLQRILQDNTSMLEVDSSPFFTRDYIHISDVLDALILIATKGSSDIYNVASGENISNKKLFKTLSQVSGCAVKPLRQNKAPAACTINIKKMRTEFGWNPTPVLNKITSLLKENIPC